jgi:hypothetical protein
MKKIKILQIMIFITITLCSCESCKEEFLTELPPETQTGANTFGCYVNGKLFVPHRDYAPFGASYLSAAYSKYNDHISFTVYGKNGSMGFTIQSPLLRTSMKIDNFGFVNESKVPYGENNVNEIYFTRFDTANKIVSGNFSCKLKCDYSFLPYVGNDTIVDITQGRFDLKLEIFDN